MKDQVVRMKKKPTCQTEKSSCGNEKKNKNKNTEMK